MSKGIIEPKTDKNRERLFYWNGEIIAVIRHDALFMSPNILSGFVWDRYEDHWRNNV